MFAAFLFASIKSAGQLNWPVTAYESGGVLTAAWLADRLRDPRPGMRRMARLSAAGGAALGVAVTLLIHLPALSRPLIAAFVGPPTPERPLPLRRLDPTCRLRGWRRSLAAAVDQGAKPFGSAAKNRLWPSAAWGLAGELGVYCTGHPAIYSIGVMYGDRSSQYDLWRPNPVFNPDDFRGKTFVLVGCVPEAGSAFDSIESSREVVYAEGDQPVQAWRVTVARGFRGLGMTEELKRLTWH